jgi:hypothetical protein
MAPSDYEDSAPAIDLADNRWRPAAPSFALLVSRAPSMAQAVRIVQNSQMEYFGKRVEQVLHRHSSDNHSPDLVLKADLVRGMIVKGIKD